MTPQRVQLRRTKGWRKPEGAVVVARGTDWGNPYRVGDMVQVVAGPTDGSRDWYGYAPTITPEIAVLLFRVWVSGRLEDQIRAELAGRDLACWCPVVDETGKRVPCHADVLLELANPKEATP